MTSMLGLQTDYVMFLSGVPFFILALAAWAISQERGRILWWKLLLLFGILWGSQIWINILGFSFGSSRLLDAVRLALIAAATMCLLIFGYFCLRERLNKHSPIWLFIIFGGVLVLGVAGGIHGLMLTTQLGFGLLGVFWNLQFIHKLTDHDCSLARKWLATGIIALGISLMIGAGFSVINLFQDWHLLNEKSSCIYNEVLLMAQLVAGSISAGSLFRYSLAVYHFNLPANFRSLVNPYKGLCKLGVTLGLVLSIGWGFTYFIMEKLGTEELQEEVTRRDELLNHDLENQIQQANQVISATAGNPDIIRSVTDFNVDNLRVANATLDRINQNFNYDVTYLINNKGTVFAASNRDHPETFVNLNLSQREYFKKAIQGQCASQLSVGILTGRPGIFASAPIYTAPNKIGGVVAVKKNITAYDQALARYDNIFLVNQQGLTLAASKQAWRLQLLWPAQESFSPQLMKYSPNNNPSPLLQKPKDNSLIWFEDQLCIARHYDLQVGGWMLLSLNPIHHIFEERMLGIFFIMLATLLIVAFGTSFRMRLSVIRAEKDAQTLHDNIATMDGVLGAIGHDLRNPVHAVRMLTDLLLMNKSQAEDQVLNLKRINNEAKRMADMLNRMLDTARMNSGTVQWSWTVVELANVMNTAVENVMEQYSLKPVQWSVDITPRDLSCRGDEEALIHLFENLLSNAMINTQEGEIHIEAKPLEIDGKSWIEIQIRDTGTGIKPEVIDKLTKPFILDTCRRGKAYSPGGGLGLSLCLGIASAHGGKIAIRTRMDHGTRVCVTLRSDLDEPDPSSITNKTIEIENAPV